MPNPDAQSQNIQNFNKSSANSQEFMSSSFGDETEGGETYILRNTLQSDFKPREGWIRCSG